MFNRLVNWPRLVRAGTRVSVNLGFLPELLQDMRFNLLEVKWLAIFEIWWWKGLLTYTAGPCQICGCCQPVQELHSRPGQTTSENEFRKWMFNSALVRWLDYKSEYLRCADIHITPNHYPCWWIGTALFDWRQIIIMTSLNCVFLFSATNITSDKFDLVAATSLM